MPSLKSNVLFATLLAVSQLAHAQVAEYGQCGGQGWTGGTTCASPYVCVYSNAYYSQCLPASSATGTTHTTTTTTPAHTTTGVPSTTTTTTPAHTTTTTTTTAAVGASTGLRGLNLLARAHGRYFGSAPDNIWSNTDTKYMALTGNFSEFGMITAANAMKFQSVQPSQNTYTYTDADDVVAWTQKNGQTMRGHNFVWYNQLSSFVTNGNYNNASLIAILQSHIANEAGRYKGEVYCWDVINEPFNDDGTWRSDVWYNTIGPAFIPIALAAARAADPNAKLYINDYNIETEGAKSNAHYTLAQQMVAQGAPLGGIGCESHLIVGEAPSTAAMVTNFARFIALGLEWAMTELDIRMTLPETTALETQQATDYATVVSACVQSTGCVGITTWDTSDDYSWVPSTFSGQGDALLFDSNKNPKPAYYSVANVLAAATVNGHFVAV